MVDDVCCPWSGSCVPDSDMDAQMKSLVALSLASMISCPVTTGAWRCADSSTGVSKFNLMSLLFSISWCILPFS